MVAPAHPRTVKTWLRGLPHSQGGGVEGGRTQHPKAEADVAVVRLQGVAPGGRTREGGNEGVSGEKAHSETEQPRVAGSGMPVLAGALTGPSAQEAKSRCDAASTRVAQARVARVVADHGQKSKSSA